MKIQNIAFTSVVLMTLAAGASLPSSAQTAATTTSGDSKNCPTPGQTYDVKTGGCIDTIHPGMALDWTVVGGTKESHMNYTKGLAAEDRDYISSICKIPYKNRTEKEKTFCADIQ